MYQLQKLLKALLLVNMSMLSSGQSSIELSGSAAAHLPSPGVDSHEWR